MESLSNVKNPELVRFGHYFLSMINDLKRRPEDVAKELDVPLEEIMDIIEGRKTITENIVNRAKKIWPVSSRDFYLIEDDCPDGIKIMRSADSKKSARIMNRGGKPYYEYRDTAVSSVGLFRPEWIEELCIVDNNEPNNKSIHWNKGHFMHQFTYFIGDVNYYYLGSNGEKKVAVMNTGDSVYGTPFRPHTFATRKGAKKNGLILALTYGNQLSGDTQQELSVLGKDLAINFWLDFSNRTKAFGELLKFHMACSSLTFDELSKRTKIEKNDLITFSHGSEIPSYDIIKNLAKGLNVNSRDLLPPDIIEDKVIVRYYNDAPKWYFPESDSSYKITELSHSTTLPFSKAFEFEIIKNDNNELDLNVGLHQYIYNVGDKKIKLNWKIQNTEKYDYLEPGDSAYIKPNLPHNFRGDGKLMVLRIAGRIPGDAQRELSYLDNHDVNRAIEETTMWFDPKEKQK